MKKYIFLFLLFPLLLGCYKDVDGLALHEWEEGGEPLMTLSNNEVSGPPTFRRTRIRFNSGYYFSLTDEMQSQVISYSVYVNNEKIGFRLVDQAYFDLTGVSGETFCVEVSFNFIDGQESKKSEPLCITL